MGIFDSKKDNSPTVGSNNGNPQPPLPGVQPVKKWRARVNCIYAGIYITAGTVVNEAEMKNENFEEVE
jgi:hypothetical protein